MMDNKKQTGGLVFAIILFLLYTFALQGVIPPVFDLRTIFLGDNYRSNALLSTNTMFLMLLFNLFIDIFYFFLLSTLAEFSSSNKKFTVKGVFSRLKYVALYGLAFVAMFDLLQFFHDSIINAFSFYRTFHYVIFALLLLLQSIVLIRAAFCKGLRASGLERTSKQKDTYFFVNIIFALLACVIASVYQWIGVALQEEIDWFVDAELAAQKSEEMANTLQNHWLHLLLLLVLFAAQIFYFVYWQQAAQKKKLN